MRRSILIRRFGLALAVGLSLSSCSSLTSTTYTRGIIQSSRPRKVAATDAPAPQGPTIRVERFTESRTRNCAESHTLWLAWIPGACAATYWDRPDWLLWDESHSAYKPVGQDMAEALKGELDEAGLCGRVLGPADSGDADWVLHGDVRQLRLLLRPHMLGLTLFAAPIIGELGIPLGSWRLDQEVALRLEPKAGGAPIWQHTIRSEASGLMAAYYGGTPLQFGYPYAEAMGPVRQALLAELPPVLQKHPVAAVHRPAPAIVPQPESAPPAARATAEIVPPAKAGGVTWALVVGVSEYRDSRVPSLRYAGRDARAFHDWLIAPDGGRLAPARVRLLVDKDATAEELRNALFEWLKQPLAEDQVIVYFAGHGTPESADAAENLFLLPYDADYSRLAATAFPMWDVETALKRYIRSQRVIVMIDACHAAGVGEGFEIARRAGRGMSVNAIADGCERLATSTQRVCMMCASASGQFSQEDQRWDGGHGVFTYELLRGLRGEADFAHDGTVNLGELTQFVSQEVRRETHNSQTPIVSGRYDPAWPIGR